MTHPELVKLAVQWLTRQGCSVVTTEIATQGEEPDAIGWRGIDSTLVECKASRADFLNDAQKPHRLMPASGIGQNRYFLCPPTTIRLAELPPGWGLLEITGSKIKVMKKAVYQPANHRHELRILLSVIRRIGATAPVGMSIKYYTIATGNRAELHVETE